jgi:hypothetical protein
MATIILTQQTTIAMTKLKPTINDQGEESEYILVLNTGNDYVWSRGTNSWWVPMDAWWG